MYGKPDKSLTVWNQAILSAMAKNVLHFTSCVAGTIFLSTVQAGSQSIENLLHEGEARDLVSTSVTG